MSNLDKLFQKELRVKLGKKLGLTNFFAIPRLLKIVVNIGLGEALLNKKVIEEASKQISLICGQKPVVIFARRDISAFKLRKGDPIGIKLTLRRTRMFDFLEKLIKIVLPRIRDFRGLDSKGFDGKGGYTLGISEQIVFPEIDYDKIDKIRGLEITLVTSGRNKEETKALLETLGMPFKKENLRSQPSNQKN